MNCEDCNRLVEALAERDAEIIGLKAAAVPVSEQGEALKQARCDAETLRGLIALVLVYQGGRLGPPEHLPPRVVELLRKEIGPCESIKALFNLPDILDPLP